MFTLIRIDLWREIKLPPSARGPATLVLIPGAGLWVGVETHRGYVLYWSTVLKLRIKEASECGIFKIFRLKGRGFL